MLKDLMLTNTEIGLLAERAESIVYGSGSRSADRAIIAGAIQEGIMRVLGKLDIQIQASVVVDLNKHQ